jgi:hypothetical protein
VGIAVAILVGVAGFFVRERLRVRHLQLGADAPLLAKLDADLAELRHQRRLMLNISTWFLTPFSVAMGILLGTMFLNRPTLLHDSHQKLFWAGYVAMCVLAIWMTRAINRRAVRISVEPRIADLERLRHHLVSPE